MYPSAQRQQLVSSSPFLPSDQRMHLYTLGPEGVPWSLACHRGFMEQGCTKRLHSGGHKQGVMERSSDRTVPTGSGCHLGQSCRSFSRSLPGSQAVVVNITRTPLQSHALYELTEGRLSCTLHMSALVGRCHLLQALNSHKTGIPKGTTTRTCCQTLLC